MVFTAVRPRRDIRRSGKISFELQVIDKVDPKGNFHARPLLDKGVHVPPLLRAQSGAAYAGQDASIGNGGSKVPESCPNPSVAILFFAP